MDVDKTFRVFEAEYFAPFKDKTLRFAGDSEERAFRAGAIAALNKQDSVLSATFLVLQEDIGKEPPDAPSALALMLVKQLRDGLRATAARLREGE